MKNKHLRQSIAAALITAIIFVAAACSGVQNDESPYEQPPIILDQPAVEPSEPIAPIEPAEPSEDDFGELSNVQPTLSGTITISQAWIHQNLDLAIRRFTTIHPDVEIRLNCFGNDWRTFNTEISSQLAEGTGDDIIEVSGLPLIDFADMGLVADLLPLMRNDPNFNEADYFMNVINAFKYRGGLYMFPTTFYYLLIGVNNTHSEDIVEKFRQFETISHRQMLDLYLGLENRDELFVGLNANAFCYIDATLSNFIDFENKTVNFDNDEFIRILYDWKNVTDPQLFDGGGNLPTGGGAFLGVSRSAQIERASRYLFAAYFSTSYALFFPRAEQELFTHFIPQTMDNGEVIVNTGGAYFINSASDNIELAWEFLKFLSTDVVFNGTRARFSMPINREVFRNTISLAIDDAVSLWEQLDGMSVDGEIEDVTEQIFETISVFNELPMRFPNSFWGDHFVVKRDIITSFYNGELTAAQTAAELQYRVSAFLAERG